MFAWLLEGDGMLVFLRLTGIGIAAIATGAMILGLIIL
jgi:hypothetical protein